MKQVDKTLIQRRFARSLGSYGSAAEVQRDMAGGLCDLLTLATGERQFERVVELGCGTGILTELLAERFDYAELTLIDLVPECAGFHRTRTGAKFLAGDIETMELPEGDLYLSNATIQWAHDPGQLLHRIAGKLPPDGIFAFSTFAPGTLGEITQLTGRGLSYLPQSELITLLEAANFEVLAAREVEYTQLFDTPLEALKSLKSTGVTASGGATRWTRKRLAEFSEGYLTQFRREDGCIPLTYHPLSLIARRQKA